MHLVLALVLACGPKPLPDHLRLDAPRGGEPLPDHLPDLAAAIDVMLGRDPLARSTRLPDTALLADLDQGRALQDYVRTVRQVEKDGSAVGRLHELEARNGATAAVALARGYRLRAAEDLLAQDPRASAETQLTVLHLLTPLVPAVSAERTSAPLGWLAGAETPRDAVLAWGDGWVLRGWLDGPEIPLEPVARRLATTQYDALRDAPVGQLVAARAEGREGPSEAAWADLERATRLALQKAAADRDKEQAAWAAARKAAAAELDDEDPIGLLLERAAAVLTDAAGDDRAAGGAFLALEASRWTGACAKRGKVPSQAACRGLDRVQSLRAAGRWHPDVEILAQVWRVVALKEALDGMDVGHGSVMYPNALLQLLDALLGTGAGPFDTTVLLRSAPDATVWLALGRAVGVDGTTDWTSARAALGSHLRRETERALTAARDPETRALLERVSRRAVP